MITERDGIPVAIDDDKDNIPNIMEKQRNYFNELDSNNLNFRIEQLKKLKKSLKKHDDLIVDSIQKDMGRPVYEAYAAEISVVIDEINHNIKNLKKWAKPDKIGAGMVHFPSKAQIELIPKGVVLIVGAWNYPIHLVFMPLISALAAGNCAILKPSELSPFSSQAVADIVQDTFDEGLVSVVQGGVNIAQALMKQQFDHILFTGSESVGRIYAEEAAKTLTPITLELGGKSPTIVDKSAKLRTAARRIAFGKFLNAGQTCVAPDYVIVHQDVKEQLIEEVKSTIYEFYGDDARESDFGRIVNNRHLDRLQDLLESVDESSIITGGVIEPEQNYFSPTLVDEPNMESKIMKQEIFGPILPFIEFNTIDEIQEIVNRNPNPLVLYIFAEDKEFTNKIKSSISSGDVAINIAAVHFGIGGLSVGGIKSSGLGAYRGKIGFDTFSHKRAVFKKSTFLDHSLNYPPYTSFKKKLLKFFFR